MQYQTFRGTDVREALANVRQAFGADAWIESTRHVSNGQDGVFGQSFVEVVAAPAPFGGARPARVERQAADEMAFERQGLSDKARAFLEQSPRERINKSIERALSSGKLGRAGIERELVELREVVGELKESFGPRTRAQATLLGAGFEAELARSLGEGAPGRARGAELRKWLHGRLLERLLVEPGLIDRPYRQAIACVGPTGVGKTTTLAKLAAQATLKLGHSVSVVGLDTFRVGAREQWLRLAELLEVPFEAAGDVEEFAAAVAGASSDLVLIDTTGHNGQAEAGGSLLGRCLEQIRDLRVEVLLVLPAWLRACDARRLCKVYTQPSPSGIILTKVDETTAIGGVLDLSLTRRLPLTYLCAGGRIPEDLQDANASQLADLLFAESV